MTALPAARAMRTLTEAAAPALPNFVCFGAYKCGTTWLYQCLGEHPQVFLPHFKEIDFFQRKDGTRAYHSRGIGWYRALYADAGRAPLRGDISPGYLTDAEAPRLIAASLPEPRQMPRP